MQVLCHIIPSLVKLRKEGLDGHEKIKSYIWWISLGFAILEGVIVACYSLQYSVYAASHRFKHVIVTSFFLVLGAMSMTWICDTISESGFGQGSSLIICVGILTGYTDTLHKMLSQLSADPKKTEHLRALYGANERLHLIKANLLEEGSFDSVVDGCEGVFHTASPFYHDVTDPQAELIDPAVKGTLNVLGSCIKTPSVKRVIVTSSIAAVAYNGRPRTPDVVVDETWFSNSEFCRMSKLWYVLSKTLAEEAAWKFAKENSIDMVTINPGMVIGPLLQPTLNTSSAAILNLIKGVSTYPNAAFTWVSVQDVAKAHILAYEVPTASGRYCLVERVAHYSEIVKILQELYPSLQLPQKCADDKPFMQTYQVSKEKTKGLGIDYIPLKTSLKETVESLKEKGFVSF
ncbi:uncharacterized protein A4U43_UnF6340 [Asparagus officinalis]|uniref:NAD-dependent epimerase/dehydratase domain-containing protein n=1 Tax=Asparagus officinalis TaxID=4686 RepID=A0A1R3L6H0_ASPOF|nr:uncharacterized protein A4U43_UnF6340 [Asparagus officinalis]